MQSIAQQKTINPNNKKPSVFRTVFPWRKNKRILHAKAMCLRHVADSREGSPPRIQKQPRLRLFFVNDEQKGASF